VQRRHLVEDARRYACVASQGLEQVILDSVNEELVRRRPLGGARRRHFESFHLLRLRLRLLPRLLPRRRRRLMLHASIRHATK
jgi:hypothetical protein